MPGVRSRLMGKPGSVIQDYVERAFGRFLHLRSDSDPPFTPWTPPSEAAKARITEHLADRYGVGVKKLTPLDAGVFRVDRGDGSSWVARVFPPARSLAAVEGDAAVLRLLETRAFPAEQLADDDPISVADEHPVLVTKFVKGKPPGATAAVGAWQGDALGQLHSVPLDALPKRRVGGGWHGLSLNGGGRAEDVAILFTLLADLRRLVPADRRKHVDALRDALGTLDLCDGLPQALVHVDFGGPNVLKSPGGSFTVVDWTGSGPGPRIENVAATSGPLPPAAMRAAAKAYRGHVELTPEEFDRLEGTLLTHQLVLACWGVAMMPAQLPVVAAQLPQAGPAMQKRAEQVKKAFAA